MQLTVYKNGFLGVDIFFVISGYLMAILYYSGSKEKCMSNFFLRRAKRILPAYFTTVILSSIVFLFIIKPHEFYNLRKDLIYSALLLPNIGTWLDIDYFVVSIFRPLLHLWSLGVEIQFYILVPLLLIVHKISKLLIVIIAIISFILCINLTGRHFDVTSLNLSRMACYFPKTTFLLTPFRLWEFIIGFLTAKYLSRGGERMTDKYSFIGLAAMIILVIVPTLELGNYVHPGFYALWICLSAAVVLVLGIPQKVSNSFIGSILETTGKYSYSLYLVHLPILLFYFHIPFGGNIITNPTTPRMIAAITTIVAVSILMFRFVESPIRQSIYIKLNRGVNYILLGLISISVIILSGVAYRFWYLRSYPEDVRIIYDSVRDRAPFRCGYFAPILRPKDLSCKLTSNIALPSLRILLVGDSHADAIKTAFTDEAEKRGAAIWLALDNGALGQGEGCSVEAVINEIIKYNIDVVVLHSQTENMKHLIGSISKLIDKAVLFNFKVVVIDPTPEWDDNIPVILLEHKLRGRQLPSLNIETYEKYNAEYFNYLSSINSTVFFRYKVGHIYCAPDCLLTATDGKPLYRDKHHLSLTGAKYMLEIFSDIISRNISNKK